MSDAIICRCEEVTRKEIEDAISDGATGMDEVKRCTRAGMGLCQGRTCRRQVEKILSDKTGKGLKDIKPSNYRQPVRPIKMEVLTVLKEEE
ncbi:MAG: (2Fe-2S)-binding protein [Clostridia bacterium BRH_c25]|nr:MAG: (2Fe-2S)-binding protein [Clostridia bacterium BRH_c25]